MTSGTKSQLPDLIRSRVPATVDGDSATRDHIVGIATIIAEQFHPERIVLFGSHAYGTPTPDSDLDFMVIMDSPEKITRQTTRIRQAVRRQYRVPLDILVRKPDQIALSLTEGDFFIEDVMTKGVILFEAGDTELGREGRRPSPSGAAIAGYDGTRR